VPWSLQGSYCRNKLASFVMEGAQGSSNVTKHNKRQSPVERWRPVSTEAVPQHQQGLCVCPVPILHSCCTLMRYHHYSQRHSAFKYSTFLGTEFPKHNTFQPCRVLILMFRLYAMEILALFHHACFNIHIKC
jgi:hypothetical protein